MNVKLVVSRVVSRVVSGVGGRLTTEGYDWELVCGRLVISSVKKDYTTLAGAERAGKRAAGTFYTYQYGLYDPLHVVKTVRNP